MNATRRHLLKGLGAGAAALALTAGLGLHDSHEALAGSAVVLKVSSLAPEGTPWYDMLREMDKEFRQISGGTVEMKIYPGGVLGNETQIIKKMRIGQIHGAMLTSVGINDFDSAALTIQIPGLIQTYDELDYIMAEMKPTLDSRLKERGYQPLGWGEVGWARFFSKSPVTTPEDLQKQKIYAWEGDTKAIEVYKLLGLNPVVVASTDMLPSLQTGLVEAIPTTALAALSYQWFGIANHMVEVKWAPMIGALLVDNKAWAKIPAELQPKLVEAAERINAEFKMKIRKMDTEAVDVMKKNGLTVHAPADPKAWAAFAEKTHSYLRTNVFPTDIFDQVMALHKAYLAKGAATP